MTVSHEDAIKANLEEQMNEQMFSFIYHRFLKEQHQASLS